MAPEDPISQLPHREPFLFLTKIGLIRAGESGTGVWLIRGDEAFFKGHFPGDPVVPGVLITEGLAQLAGLVATTDRKSGGRLAHVNVKFHASVRPPAEVRLETRVERSIGSLWLFGVRASCAGIDVASGSLALTFGGSPCFAGGS